LQRASAAFSQERRSDTFWRALPASGPPRKGVQTAIPADTTLRPTQLRAWCERAGVTLVEAGRVTGKSYAVLYDWQASRYGENVVGNFQEYAGGTRGGPIRVGDRARGVSSSGGRMDRST
jgi:hypothetical protein